MVAERLLEPVPVGDSELLVIGSVIVFIIVIDINIVKSGNL